MKRKLTCLAFAVVLITCLAFHAYGQAKPEVLVKQRQAAMTLLAKYFGQLSATAQGRGAYDQNTAARTAGYLDALGKMPWDGFDPATKDLKTGAAPAVFADTAKFKEAQDRFNGEIGRLVSLSKGADEAAVKAQIAAIGKTCGACHDSFRQK